MTGEAWSAGRVRDRPELALVPGLGSRGYLRPLAREVATWTRATILDLPGWWRGRARNCRPTTDGIADAVRRWAAERPGRRMVLVGHSTGAQAVARAAADLPPSVAGVVLAGPVFAPTIRTWPALLRAAAATVPAETPGELAAVLPSYLHSGLVPLVRLLADGLREGAGAYASVAGPVTVITGRRDELAPPWWASELAVRLGGPMQLVPGGHNCVYRHPQAVSAVLRDTVSGW